MKAVILAGGFGTRISEESATRPKPMIEIGGKPILWHILKMYSTYGVNDFVICCGYKGYTIKEYFANYFLHMSDVTFDISQNTMEVHNRYAEPWKVTLIDTGENTMTGGRLKRVKRYVENDQAFYFTYGDGLSNLNLSDLLKFHNSHGKMASVTAVYPPGRFGAIDIDSNNRITSFREKPKGDGGMINGGFFILSPKVIELIVDDSTIWEREPLEWLAKNLEVMAYKHDGFWQPMDTLRDKNYLEDLWFSGNAPWKTWR